MNTISAPMTTATSNKNKTLQVSIVHAQSKESASIKPSAVQRGFATVEKINHNDLSLYSTVEQYSKKSALNQLLGFSIYV